MNDEQRDKAVLHTLENSQADLLEAVKVEADARHEALRKWQHRMERRWHFVAVMLTLMVAIGLAAGVAAGLLLSGQNDKVDDVVRAQARQVAASAAQSEQVNGALCAYRHDLQVRAEQGVAFLHDHPHGFAGFSASSIRVSLAGQQRTIMVLSAHLKCGERKGNP